MLISKKQTAQDRFYVHYTNKHNGEKKLMGFKEEKAAAEFAIMVEGTVSVIPA